MMRKFYSLFFFFCVSSISCVVAQKSAPLFTLMKSESTQLRFTNKVREDDSLHVLVYEYLYNGHGIGIGDFNLDGRQDIFISGNTTPNKLFINNGNFAFDDITKETGVSGNNTWSTGVSIADVNGDGLPDIYVCHSGKFNASKLSNELFINQGLTNGKPVFKEQAKLYGLDAPGTQSTQAAFFDYDRDGDLDMFLLNHSINTYNALLNTRKTRSTPDARYGNRLFRNDTPSGSTASPVFTDVTLSSGIINNPLNYGLSVNISDLNQDGWPDIYTTSDYSEHDCYYVNNKNGTFTQSLQKSFAHISKFSMGADVADYNNDGLPDVFTLDMLPEDNHRQKLLKGPDEYDQYHLLLDSGYYHQNMRNMLQLNRGIDTNGNVRFSEIGQLAGVSNTDWSWSGLLADFDCDGWKDLMVTNGYLRDFTDMDFLKYTLSDAQLAEAAKGNLNFRSYKLVQKMPSNKLNNYLFKNNKDLTFKNVSKEWGFTIPSISNAAAYADFDNDGDLDLIIGNNNEPVTLWRNNTPSNTHHWIQINLTSKTGNTFALGSKIRAYADGTMQYQEVYPVRGFQSTVTSVIYFATRATTFDSLVVQWPSGKTTVLREVQTGKILSLSESDVQTSTVLPTVAGTKKTLFTPASQDQQLTFLHQENDFVDFKVEVLMPYQLSRLGPALTKGDVNGDGNEDIFIGGAIGQSSTLFIQNDEGSFQAATQQPWKRKLDNECINAIFFDVDNDHDLDLYLVHGGNEYLDDSPELQDQLYINDGKGNFALALKALPSMRSNKQAISVADIDRDGDLDLFVGGRGKSGYFPESSRSYVLRNDSEGGKILFTDVTKETCTDLLYPGMVTVASWTNLDQDLFPELIIAGEWMAPLVFKNTAGKLSKAQTGKIQNAFGLWSALLCADIDGDGDQDIVLGNCGMNNQFKPTGKEPMTLYSADFDGNGVIDPIMCYYIQGKSYPMASRDELLDQLQYLKKRYIKYNDYADATVETIFSKEQLAKAKVLQCTEARSLILINDGDLNFSIQELPLDVQFSKVQSILYDDVDDDDIADLIFTGNFFSYRTQLGNCDASLGTFLKGKGKGSFESVPPSVSGLFVDGDVRHATIVSSKNGKRKLIVAKNNSSPQTLTIRSKTATNN